MPWLEEVKAYCAKYDLLFLFHNGDAIGRDIAYKHGVYAEDYVNEYMCRHLGLKEGGIMLDVGANIGWYSLVMGKQAKLRVHAFEPFPSNFSMLSRNIKNNGITNVEAHQLAIADQQGHMKLHLYKSHNTGRHSLVDHGATGKFVEVETTTIDAFMESKGLSQQPVEIFKIDIEGFEFAAFRGALNTLRSTRYIFSEFSPAIMKSIQEDPAGLVEMLEHLGFKAYIIRDKDHAEPIDHSILKGYQDGVHNILWSREKL